ncbi:MAG: ATP-binding protein [Anaerovoracaceae bacterium]
MNLEITRGIQKKAQKVVIYGPEGIGKSTFAAQFPDPVFIDTEGSTKNLDVARLPRPSSWTMLIEEINHVKTTKPCKTIVIDTVDWAEQMCVEAICGKHGKSGIEDFGYGNGYVYTKEEFGRFLNRLEDVIEAGIHVVLTAHAQIRKFEQPDEMGTYDRYELKLGKKTASQTSPLVKEWADMVLFANYKTLSVAVDDKGKKHKAQGGRRVMYTAHHPCWDAKNRHGLADELPFEYAQIAGCIPDLSQPAEKSVPAPTKVEAPKQEVVPPEQPKDPEVPPPETKPEPEQSTIIDTKQDALKALFDLMERNAVTREQVQCAVTEKGYYPKGTPLENYDSEFVQGVLIAAWDKVMEIIIEQLNNEIPF